MQVYKAVLKRRSIRKYKEKHIPAVLLRKMVNAARLAPSAANLQPCEYVIVNKEDMLEPVFHTLKWAGYIFPEGTPPFGHRPMAYIVVLVNRNIAKYDQGHDTGAAIQNMLLTAYEDGLGTCWLVSVDRAKLRKLLHIPERYNINSVVSAGFPDEEPLAVPLKDSIKYWVDSRNRMHVPKRRIEDILHMNGFSKK